MPRNEIDYSKTIIYKIVCNDLNITDCYVGSTTDFKTRKSAHKSNCNNEKCSSYNLKIYKMIRENGGWSNWSMLQIEKFVCSDSNEAHARERYWIEYLNSELNIRIPIRSKKENCDYYKLYKAKYYDEHKEDNKDHLKEYCIQNKEKIHIYGKQEIQCTSCNCMIKKWNLSRHNKTIKHIKNSKPNDELIKEEAKEETT